MASDIRWREGYNLELKGLYDRNGDFYSKSRPIVNTKCEEGIEGIAKIYAKESPIIKSFSSEGEFKEALSRVKRR